LGAGLVASAEDILSELGLEANQRPRALGANPREQSLLDILAEHPGASQDDLVQLSKLSPAELSGLLTHLELKGSVKAEAGCWTLA
jgi:predicted Rossmann fold nucleotide-binding protein DprA/Smf involved in DNA uptake